MTVIICYSDNCLTQESSLIFDKFALKMTNCCSSISSSHNVNVKLVLLAVLVYGKLIIFLTAGPFGNPGADINTDIRE